MNMATFKDVSRKLLEREMEEEGCCGKYGTGRNSTVEYEKT